MRVVPRSSREGFHDAVVPNFHIIEIVTVSRLLDGRAVVGWVTLQVY